MQIFTLLFFISAYVVSTSCFLFQDPCSPNPCGTGTCLKTGILFSIDYTCSCSSNTVRGIVRGQKTCVSAIEYFRGYTSGLVPPSSENSSPSTLNYYFRHLSVGFNSQPGMTPYWVTTRKWNWANGQRQVLPAVRDQGFCKSCSAFSVAAAMESALVLTNPSQNTLPPLLSVQQFLDCGVDSCAGGWIGDTFDYAARMYLVSDGLYPYLGIENPVSCSPFKLFMGKYGISMYEKVSFPGNLGLILAVMQQPVVVAVEGSSDGFLNYKGGIFDDPTCYSNGLDHTLVIVGYDLDTTPPHWILRNSWGSDWGERGHMRLAMTDGDGICGINILPALYPVVKSSFTNSDPCNTASFGSKNNGPEGRMNPCGGGTCIRKGGYSYDCVCKAPFVAATSRDGTRTCVPGSVCSFSTQNPCKMGTCIDSTTKPGDYTCVCPIGYVQGMKAGDSTPTCVRASVTQGPVTYTVPSDFEVTCDLIYTLYGITKRWFFSLNPNADCSKSIPAGTELNVTNNLGNCNVPYAVDDGDTCTSISLQFANELQGPVNGPQSPNPDLECDSLHPGQLICLKRGMNLAEKSMCTRPYTLDPKETCNSVIDSHLDGNKFLFYSLNPGIYCKFIAPLVNTTFPSAIQVCLKLDSVGTVRSGCSTGRLYTVKPGDSCYRLIGVVYKTSGNFKRLNGFACSDSVLDVGDKLCAP